DTRGVAPGFYIPPLRGLNQTSLLPLDLFVLRVNVLVGEGDAVVGRLLLFGDEQVVFGREEVGAVVDRQLEVVAVRDGVLRAGLDAEAAEDAATVVNVVNARIALVHADALCGRARVVSRDDVDAVRRARRRAEVTGDALLTPQLVNVQEVLPAVARLERHRLVRVLDRPLPLRDVGGGRHHPLDDGLRVLDDFGND